MIFDKFRKPTINARMIKKGAQVKVKIINANADQTMILLYMTIKQIALSLKVDHRHLMNKLVDLDKRIIKNSKDEIKQAKYGHK